MSRRIRITKSCPGDAGAAGARARELGCAAAERAARRAAHGLVRDMKAHELAPHGAAVVVRSLVDPHRVTGAHARPHAAERDLYRRAVEAALAEDGLQVLRLEEARVRATAAKRLSHSPSGWTTC